jgi:hypothetical protein
MYLPSSFPVLYQACLPLKGSYKPLGWVGMDLVRAQSARFPRGCSCGTRGRHGYCRSTWEGTGWMLINSV